jgi:galactokinase
MLQRVTAQAPGRVNVLGEHTDYNHGFVLPSALKHTTRVELAAQIGDSVTVRSTTLSKTVSFKKYSLPEALFARYVFGCIRVLESQGIKVPGLEVVIDSNIPIGVGLSSSAALEIAVLRGLRQMLELSINDLDLALLANQAERQHVGVACGVLDQLACSLCEIDSMLFIDTHTLRYRSIPFPSGTTILVIDSNTPRVLAGSAYNRRRQECMEAAQFLQITHLRDIPSIESLTVLPHPYQARARHVFTENQRVSRALHASAQQFGKLMSASHHSLQTDFEVSTPALDCLVSVLEQQHGVYGARLTGAGFGGACVALVDKNLISTIQTRALRDYAQQGYRATVLI